MSITTDRPFPELSRTVFGVSEIPGLVARVRTVLEADQSDFPPEKHKRVAIDRLGFIERAAASLAAGAAEIALLIGEEPTDPQISLGALVTAATEEHLEFRRLEGHTGEIFDGGGHIVQCMLE